MTQLTVPLNRFFDWCFDHNVLLASGHSPRVTNPLTLNELRTYFKFALDSADELWIPSENYTTIQGYLEKGNTHQHVITLEYSEDKGWVFSQCDIELTDIDFYTIWPFLTRPTRIALDLTEERLCDSAYVNVDDQYWTFDQINIYKDAEGFFTTTTQLDDKDIGSVSILLNCYHYPLLNIVPNHLQVARLLGVLSHTKFMYNQNEFNRTHALLKTYVDTGLAKMFNFSAHPALTNSKNISGKFTQLPNFPDYIFKVGTDKEAIDIINIKAQTFYRLYFYNL